MVGIKSEELVLKVSSLKKDYGWRSKKKVLGDISFTVPKGKCVSIVGKNG